MGLLWFYTDGINSDSEMSALIQFDVSGVGLSRVNTAQSGPYCDIQGGRIHCWVLQRSRAFTSSPPPPDQAEGWLTCH